MATRHHNNRVCVVCGTSYDYCITCKHNRLVPDERWKTIFHDENCRSIYHAIAAYRSNQISIEEARQQLSALDMSINIVDGLKNVVAEIMQVQTEDSQDESDNELEEPVDSESQVVTEPIKQEENTVETVTTQEIRQPYEYKKYGKKKKNR